jgi:hypothetical protein
VLAYVRAAAAPAALARTSPTPRTGCPYFGPPSSSTWSQ